MAEMDLVKIPSEKWMEEVGPALQRHVQSLPPGYFREGNLRLENLKQWARGNSTLEPPVESKRKRPTPSTSHP